jgi:hypothetical protein
VRQAGQQGGAALGAGFQQEFVRLAKEFGQRQVTGAKPRVGCIFRLERRGGV